MLTIKNVASVYRRDVAGYRISKVTTSPNAYLFTMRRWDGAPLVVTLKRTQNQEDGEPVYNMWCAKDGVLTSLNFKLKFFLTPDAFLSALNLVIM